MIIIINNKNRRNKNYDTLYRIMQDEPKELSPQIAAWFLGPKVWN